MKALRSTVILVLFSILLFGFSNCGGTKNNSGMTLQQNPPFSISEVTYQDWVAGVQGGGSGTNVNVNFVSVQGGVVMQQLYFHNNIVALQPVADSATRFSASFETDKNRADNTMMDIDPKEEATNTPREKFPFDLTENEAVISYSYQGKTNYFKIDTMTKKPTMALPSSNEFNGIEN